MISILSFGKKAKENALSTKKCSPQVSITHDVTLLGVCEGWLARLCGYKHLAEAPEYIQQTLSGTASLLISRVILSDSAQLTIPRSLESRVRETLVHCLYEYAKLAEPTTTPVQDSAGSAGQSSPSIPTLTFKQAKKK